MDCSRGDLSCKTLQVHGHPDLTSFPVNVRIMVFQPRVSENHLVPAEIGYLGYYLFSMTLEINDYFGVMSDVTS